MTPVSFQALLDAAAYALISTRCQQAYLHEARGGLQALQSAIELLARSTTAAAHTALAEKSVALARRSMSNHEKALTELLRQMWPQDETAQTVNLTAMIDEVLLFLRNDAMSRSITLNYQPTADIVLTAARYKLRTLVLGLCIMSIDDLPSGAALDVALRKDGTHALLEFEPIMSYAPVRARSTPWQAADFPVRPFELLLTVANDWIRTAGGRLEQSRSAEHRTRLQIYYPLAHVS